MLTADLASLFLDRNMPKHCNIHDISLEFRWLIKADAFPAKISDTSVLDDFSSNKATCFLDWICLKHCKCYNKNLNTGQQITLLFLRCLHVGKQKIKKEEMINSYTHLRKIIVMFLVSFFLSNDFLQFYHPRLRSKCKSMDLHKKIATQKI